jgi:hypothetical protein
MTRIFFSSAVIVMLLCAAGCSISPEKPVSRRELINTKVFSEFTIKDSPESVLAILNREGEVVLEGKSRYGEEFFIKILATNSGIKIRLYAK